MLDDVPRPHPSRCDPTRSDYDVIISAHETAVTRGEIIYRDPSTGLSVLTVLAHLERGACCASNCRHCPFIEEN